MARVRSPGYPSIGLKQAIEIVKKIYDKVRRNPIDRESAAKEVGYSGMTGAAAKMLSNLTHFGLIEKAGKGDLRVSEIAVEALYGHPESKKRAAIWETAFAPELFAQIRERHPDGFVSEIALRNLLKREGFAEIAITPAVNSYLNTYTFLQEQGAIESHSAGHELGDDSSEESDGFDGGGTRSVPALIAEPARLTVSATPATSNHERGTLMEGERIVFSEETGPAQSLRLIAKGDLDASLLEALEDYIKRQKKRLGMPPKSVPSE